MKDGHLVSICHSMMDSKRSRKPLFAALVVVVLVVLGGWHWHQTQPITPTQQVTIASLIDRSARKRNVTHQRIYADLLKHFNIRRTQDLTTAQYPQAIDYLTPMAR